MAAHTQSSHLLVQNVLGSRPSNTGFLSCLGPFFSFSTVSTTSNLSKRLPEPLKHQWQNMFFLSTSTIRRFYPVSSWTLASSSFFFHRPSCSRTDSLATFYEEVDEFYEDESEIEELDEDIKLEGDVVDLVENSGEVTQVALSSNGLKVPGLTVKEKKDLASYAHSLGKKLKAQSIGKSGVTANVATSFIETLEANELLKIKIHRTCPGELDEVVKQLEEATGSLVVGKIGRTVIIYRPSISKLISEEKKRHASKVFVRKPTTSKSAASNKERVLPFSRRDRRGGNRLSIMTR